MNARCRLFADPIHVASPKGADQIVRNDGRASSARNTGNIRLKKTNASHAAGTDTVADRTSPELKPINHLKNKTCRAPFVLGSIQSPDRRVARSIAMQPRRADTTPGLHQTLAGTRIFFDEAQGYTKLSRTKSRYIK
ncbi:hypothetical protein [Burkholderia ubonensis]|uniref:hypothetical protein n=1 Tax=Burkholderia ubonensis TaxID=101571 RepID=UPI0018DFB49B|nr:hypothetical protein [Burkholderia ubonensis]